MLGFRSKWGRGLPDFEAGAGAPGRIVIYMLPTGLGLIAHSSLAGDKCGAMKSRVNREVQARFREGLGVKSPRGYSTRI